MAKHLKVLVSLALWAHMIIGVICIAAGVGSLFLSDSNHWIVVSVLSLCLCIFSATPWMVLYVLHGITMQLELANMQTRRMGDDLIGHAAYLGKAASVLSKQLKGNGYEPPTTLKGNGG